MTDHPLLKRCPRRRLPNGGSRLPVLLRLFVLLFLILCSLTPPTAMAAHDSTIIRVGAYENQPKIFSDSAGGFIGIFPDILNDIAQREGWTLQYVPGTWTECLERLARKEIDIMVDVAYSDERAKQFAFSNETLLVNWGSVYTRKGVELPSLLALGGKKIAVMKGSIHTDGDGGIKSLAERFDIKCSFLEVDSYRDVFTLLADGKVDAGVVNRVFGTLFEEEFGVHKSPVVFNPRHLKFAFPKDSPRTPTLISAIDRHLAALKEDPDSLYHRAIYIYLSGLPREWIFSDIREPKEHRIVLSEDEKQWIKAHPEIRLGVDPEFAPFEYFDPKGIYSGIASDYIQILNQRLGLNMRVVPGLAWKDAVEKSRNKEIDVLPCVGITQERQSFLHFSKPYIEFYRVLITRTDTPFLASLDDVRTKRVAVQANTSHEGYLKDHTEIVPMGFATLQEALTAVSQGKADAFVGNIASSTYWIRKLNLTNLKVAAPVSQETQSLHFAVRKDWPILTALINKGLASITAEEETAIRQRWVNIEYTPGIAPHLVIKYVLLVVGIALFILTGFLFWNAMLKKEIAKRKAIEQALNHRLDFENLLLAMSSTFIDLKPAEIDAQVNLALREIGDFAGADSGFIYRFTDDTTITRTHDWHSERMTVDRDSTQVVDTSRFPWWRDTLLADRVIPLSSVSELPDEAVAEIQFLKALGINSTIHVPMSYGGAVLGFLGVSSIHEGRRWSEDEICLLRLISQIFTNALERKAATEALQNAHDQLELRVENRTAELAQANAALHSEIIQRQEAQAELSTAHDQLEIKVEQRTRELSEANERLHELDQLKSMFIASMSHELRTPLNSIIGFTGIILQGMSGELNAKQRDQLNRVFNSAKHLLALISDVIDISKVEAGRIDVFPERFELAEIVDEAIVNIQPQLNQKNLTLTKEIPAGIKMNTDRKRLLQCIINYLSNAVKFTESGEVKITATEAERMVAIEVSDTGIGIAEEDIPKLFEAFERLESRLRVKAGGTGLGLYLTKKLATELLHGSITVHSEVGKGSRFGITIPKDLETTAMQGGNKE